MDNVSKENDILVSSLLNPEASIKDLIFNGVKASNTLFLTPDKYKESDFIKSKFTDEQGKFHDDLFDKLYELAANKYQQLGDLETFDEWNKLNIWNPNSIYSPIDSKKLAKNPSISRIRNPFEQTTGLRALYKTEESNKSIRELAQKNKIFDTATGKYLDKSAEDLGLFGGLFSTPLVYATWDEDGEHFDESLGRTVKHKKGEFKLNEDGKFYTETIGDRLGYGKQYVALSDILTKEDSWLNKIDFFDSDDKDKSIGGTIAKTLFKISPYFIPGFNKIYGGVTALWALSEIMPTFAKAIEGIFIGDRETTFTKKMNLLENYAGKFKPSYSDEAQGKMFGIEQFGSMLADIFGQLYQMKWMAELSRFSKLGSSFDNQAAFENFISKHGAEFDALVKQGKIKPTKEGITDFWKSIVAQTPEMQSALKSQQELAKRLSLGYMSFLLSADIYSEAILGGFDKRMAGAAALAAMAGLYGIMMNNELGTWFLRATTGYAENENRWLMRKTLKPLFEQFQNDFAALPREATTQEKQAILGKIFNKTNKALSNLWDGIKNGSEQFWTRSTIEAVEEVTEEAVMDMTKGVFDILSWAGIGKNSDTATFNTVENTFSKEGFARYAQNALGGFIGGSLFQFQENYVEPWITGKKIDRNTMSDMILLILTGHAEDLKKAALSLGNTDNNILSSEIPFGDKSVQISSLEGLTRGLLAASKVIDHINWIQGLLDDYNLKLSGNDLFKKVVRDQLILPIIKESGISEILNSDFHLAVADLVNLLSEIETLQTKENRSEDEETKLQEFISERKEKTEWINKFLNGELYEPYLKMALIYTNSNIRDNLSDISLYQYTESVYNKKFSELPPNGVGTTQESIKKEYENFKNSTDKKEHLQALSAAFDHLEQVFSTPIFEYSNSKYGDVRRKVFDKIISGFNLSLDTAISNADYYNLLLSISNELVKLGQKAVSLQDIIVADNTQILDLLEPMIDSDQRLITAISEVLGMTTDLYKLWFSNLVYQTINSMPVETWNVQSLNLVIIAATNTVSNEIITKLALNNPELSKLDIDLFLTNAGIEPSDLEVINLLNYLTYKIGKLLTDVNVVENLSKNTLSNYIQQENILDDEIVRFIKKSSKQLINRRFLNTLSRSLSSIGWEDPEFGEVSFLLTALDLVNIKQTIEQGVDKGDSIEQIIENILNDPVSGIIVVHLNEEGFPEESKMFRENPDFVKQAENILREHLKEFDLYNKTVGREVINPLYDILRKVLFELTNNVSDTIFNLLEKESVNLLDLSSIEEYIKMPDVIEQIDTAISVLHTVKAILAGMEDGEVNFSDRLFGFNALIAKYLEKYQNGRNVDKYKVINTEEVVTIGKDLELIESKLNFIKALSSKNTDSKVAEDNNSRVNFLNLIARELINNASKLNIKGVSIFTNDDQSKLLDDSLDISVRLGLVEHSMFEKFNEILKTSDLKESVNILLDNLGLNKEAITLSSLESYGINPRVTAISPYDIFVYLATVLGHDQNDYNFRYKQYLQSEEFNKVPLFGQEYGVKVAYSFLQDNLGIHQEFSNYLLRDQEYPAKASNIYFADGVSGAGKTTAIAQTLLNMSNIDNIIVSAPNSNLANKLKESLKIETAKTLSKQELLSMFLKADVNLTDKEHIEQVSIKVGDDEVGYYRLKNVEDSSLYKENIGEVPNLIFIDEATHFNTAELQVLDYMANKYNFKIIALGDTFLESTTINEIENHIDSIFTWKSARLNISIRPANENKKENIDRLSTMIDSYYEKLRSSHNQNEAIQNLRSNLSKGLILKYYEDESSIKGDKIVDFVTSEDLNKLKKSSDGPIGIIANLTGTGNSIDNISDPNLQAAIKGSELTVDDYVIYSPDKINNFAVLGSEAKYFVVNDVNIDSSTPLEESVIRLYTQATRSQEGSIIKLNDLAKIALNISNLKTTAPNVYRLPGLNQLNDLKNKRVETINNIIGNWIPSETPNITSLSSPSVLETEDEKLIEDSVSKNPDIIVENVESEDRPSNESEGLNLLTYPFYHHTGLNQFNIGETTTVASELNLDLYGILPAGTVISLDAVLGFIKLQNLITLSDNLTEVKSGLRSSKFIKEILQLVKEIIPQVEKLGDDFILSEISKSIQVGDTQIVGISMNSRSDLPYLNSFSDLVEDGSPLLMTAKKVFFKIGDFSFDRFISTSVLAKSSTAVKANNKSIYDFILDLEDRAKKELSTKRMVIYPISANLNPYDKAEGRLIHTPNSYTSLSRLIGDGVNIKKVGLITGAKNSSGQYKFVEFAKKYNQNIEQIAFKDGEFQLSGKYFILASYSNINNNRENLIICDLNQISFNDAILKIKDSPKKLLELNKILHVASLQKLVLEMLGKMGAFDLKSGTITANGLFSEILQIFKKNPSIHALRILALEERLNSVDTLTREDVLNLLIDPRMKSFGIMFADHFTTVDDSGNIRTRFGSLSLDGFGYSNIAPVSKPNDDGWCEIDDFNLNDLGIRNYQYQIRRLSLPIQSVREIEHSSILENKKLQEVKLEPEVQLILENSQEVKTDLTNRLLDFLAIDSEEDLPDLLKDKFNFLISYGKNMDGYNLVKHVDSDLNLDDAYLTYLGEDFKLRWNLINNKETVC